MLGHKNSSVEIFGVVMTGWKADAFIFLLVAFFIALGFSWGFDAAKSYYHLNN